MKLRRILPYQPAHPIDLRTQVCGCGLHWNQYQHALGTCPSFLLQQLCHPVCDHGPEGMPIEVVSAVAKSWVLRLEDDINLRQGALSVYYSKAHCCFARSYSNLVKCQARLWTTHPPREYFAAPDPGLQLFQCKTSVDVRRISGTSTSELGGISSVSGHVHVEFPTELVYVKHVFHDTTMLLESCKQCRDLCNPVPACSYSTTVECILPTTIALEHVSNVT